MWDWTSSGLWDADRPEAMVDPADFGLSESVRERLSAWVASGDALAEREFAGPDAPPSKSEEEAFAAEGERLVNLIREELSGRVRVGFFRGGRITWE